MSLDECHRDTQEIKGISNTVRKAADNEKRDTKKKRKVLSLSAELNACGHYETAAYGKKTTSERACTKPQLHDLLCGSLDIHR
jgi:hypothetical protein